MSRIPYDQETVPAESKQLLEHVEKTFGMVPNFFSLIALSPDALKGVTALHSTIGRSLGPKTRERIHIAIAEVNGCDYCVSAHTHLVQKLAGLTAEDTALNRLGRSTDRKADAAVLFAQKVAKTRGRIDDADLAAVRAAGWSDAQIIDIIAELAFSFTTNMFNNVAETEIDSAFPILHTKKAA